MAAYFNVVDIEPTKTYASRENAEKAVRKWAERYNFPGRAFNIVILPYRKAGETDWRFFPLLCNIDKDFFQQCIHSGFNLIN